MNEDIENSDYVNFKDCRPNATMQSTLSNKS